MPSLNQNQFAQTPLLGQVSLVVNPSIISVKINPESVSAKLQAGQAVKLIAGTSAEILVDVPTSDTDGPVLGVIIYNPRKNIYAAGDTVEIATAGSCVFMEAGAAINRGAKVSTTYSGPTVVTNNTAGKQITGVAFDQAANAGDLIRVMVQPSTNPA